MKIIAFIIALMVICMVMVSPIGVRFAYADELDSQIVLKETQLQSLQWEFRYLQERAITVQTLGQRLQTEIDNLKKEKENKKKEPKSEDKK